MPPEETTTEQAEGGEYSADEIRMRLAEDRNRRQAEAAEQVPDEQGSDEPSGPRIGMAERMLMVIVALIFDGMQAFLTLIAVGFILNPVVAFFAWLTFFIWLGAKGMTFGSALKNAKSALQNPVLLNAITLVIGFVPLVNSLPERTAGTIAIIAADYFGAMKKAPLGKLAEKADA